MLAVGNMRRVPASIQDQNSKYDMLLCMHASVWLEARHVERETLSIRISSVSIEVITHALMP